MKFPYEFSAIVGLAVCVLLETGSLAVAAPGETQLVSRGDPSLMEIPSGITAVGRSVSANSTSADGDMTVFTSRSKLDGYAQGTGDRNTTYYADMQVFLHQQSTGLTQLISQDSEGIPGVERSFDAAISADGRFIVYRTWSKNLCMPTAAMSARTTGRRTLTYW